MKKRNGKLLSLVLTLVLILTMLPMTALAATNYYVAGTSSLCGEDWDCAADKMTAKGDGTYTITFKNVPAGTQQFKVTDGTWDNSWGKDGGTNNYVFENSKAGDVTITFNPNTKEIKVSGAGVGAYVFAANSITAVGAGAGAFLNGAKWEQNNASNHMTNNNGVWSITYTGVAAGTYEFKFAANDAWTDSWGTGAEVEVGTKTDIHYNGQNSKLVVTEDNTTVTLYLDLTAYDAASTSGAVTWVTFGADAGSDDKEDNTGDNNDNTGDNNNDNTGAEDKDDTTVEPKDTVTVYVTGVKNPSLWAWGAEGNVFAEWPGQALTADGAWYKTEVPGWTTGLVVNWDNAATQTKDITIEAGKDVWVTIAADGTATVSYTAPAIKDTGDGMIVLYAIMLVAGLGMVVVASKKRFA